MHISPTIHYNAGRNYIVTCIILQELMNLLYEVIVSLFSDVHGQKLGKRGRVSRLTAEQRSVIPVTEDGG